MRYKVGDKVRIIDNIIEHQFNIGDIVTVVSLSKEDGIYYAQQGSSIGWYVKDEELQDVWDNFDGTDLSYTYSTETLELVNKFMTAHSGKISDYSRIEWPTAVKITNIYLNMVINILENGNYLYELERHENILKELNK
ncbi:MAG: hypothetical protein WAZ19_02420 [Anaerolineae bacterium]